MTVTEDNTIKGSLEENSEARVALLWRCAQKAHWHEKNTCHRINMWSTTKVCSEAIFSMRTVKCFLVCRNREVVRELTAKPFVCNEVCNSSP